MTGGGQMLRACGLLFGNYPLYAVLLTAAACLSVFLAGFGLHRRGSRGAIEFILCMTAVAEWSIGYFFELIAPTLSMKLLAAQIEYLGIATLPVLWLLLAARYTARIDLARPIRVVLLIVLPAVTIGLAFTNPLHGLLWSRTWMDAAVSPPVLHVVHGPMFWVHMIYAYILLLLGTLLFIASLVTSPPFCRSGSFAMIVAAAAPWIGDILYLSGLNPSPGFDTTPFPFAVSGAAVAWVLFRHRFLDIVPFARERVIETMRNPVIVIDAADHIVDSNPAAGFLLRDSGAPSDRGLSGRVIVLHETTERRMMETVLRASEEKYRTLIESIDQVIFSLDLKGTFTYVSPVVEKVSGYTPAEIVGSPFSRFVHPDDLSLVARNMEARYRGERVQNEFRVIDRNGAVLYVRTASSPLVERGTVTGLTGIMADITEQRTPRRRDRPRLQQPSHRHHGLRGDAAHGRIAGRREPRLGQRDQEVDRQGSGSRAPAARLQPQAGPPAPAL